MTDYKYPYSDQVIKENWFHYPLCDKDHQDILWDFEGNEPIYDENGKLRESKIPDKYTGEERLIEKAVYVPFNATNNVSGDYKSSSDEGIKAAFNDELPECSRSYWCARLDHDNNQIPWRKGGRKMVVHYGDKTTWSSRLGGSKGDLNCFANTRNYKLGNVPRLRSETYLVKNVQYPSSESSGSIDMSQYKKGIFGGVEVTCTFEQGDATGEHDRYNITAIPNEERGFNENDDKKNIDNWLTTEFQNSNDLIDNIKLVSQGKTCKIEGINNILANEQYLKLLANAVTSSGNKSAEDVVLTTVYHTADEVFPIKDFKGTVQSTLPDTSKPFEFSNFEIQNMTIYKNQSPNYYGMLIDDGVNNPIINFLEYFLHSTMNLDLDRYYESSAAVTSSYIPPGWQRIIRGVNFKHTYSTSSDDRNAIINFPSISKENIKMFKLFVIYQFNRICHFILLRQFASARAAIKELFGSKQLYSEGIATLFTPAFIDMVLDGLYNKESFCGCREHYETLDELKTLITDNWKYNDNKTMKKLLNTSFQAASLVDGKDKAAMQSSLDSLSTSMKGTVVKAAMTENSFDFDKWTIDNAKKTLNNKSEQKYIAAAHVFFLFLYQTIADLNIAIGRIDGKSDKELKMYIANQTKASEGLVEMSEILESGRLVSIDTGRTFSQVKVEMKTKAFADARTSDMIGCIKHYETEGRATRFWPYKVTDSAGHNITIDTLEQASSAEYIVDMNAGENSNFKNASSFGFNLIKANTQAQTLNASTAWGIPAYNRPSSFYNRSIDETSIGLAVHADGLTNLMSYIDDAEVIDVDNTFVFATGGPCPGQREEFDVPFDIPFKFEVHLNAKNEMINMYKAYYSNGIKRENEVPVCACRDDEADEDECNWPKRGIVNAAFVKCEYLWKEVDWSYMTQLLDAQGILLGFDNGSLAANVRSWSLDTVKKTDDTDSLLLNDILNGDAPVSRFITLREPFCRQNIHLMVPMQQNVVSRRNGKTDYAYSANPLCHCPFWATRDGFHKVPLYLPNDRLEDSGITILSLITSPRLGAITSNKMSGRIGHLRILEELKDHDQANQLLRLSGSFHCNLHASGYSDTTGRDSDNTCPYRMKADTYFFTDTLYNLWKQMTEKSVFLDYIINSLATMFTHKYYALANLQESFLTFAEYCCLSEKTTIFNLPIGPVAMENSNSDVLGYHYFLSDYQLQYKGQSKDRKQIINTNKQFAPLSTSESGIPNVTVENNYLDMMTRGLSDKYGCLLEDDDTNAAIVVRVPEDSKTMLSIPRIQYALESTIPFVFATYINKNYKGMKAASTFLAESPAIAFTSSTIATNNASSAVKYQRIGQVNVPRLSIIHSMNGWTFDLQSKPMEVYASPKIGANIKIGATTLEIAYTGQPPANQAFIKSRAVPKSRYPKEADRKNCDTIVLKALEEPMVETFCRALGTKRKL